MVNNQFIATLLTLILAGLFLLAYPLLHPKVPLLQAHFKNYAALGSLVKNTGEKNRAVDSIPHVDTLALLQSLKQDSAAAYISPELMSLKDYSGAFALIPFFEALTQKDTQVRVAYYGDSSIEGDLISQTVRDSLQRRFGGRGVGFMPITSKTNGFRRSVKHFFSNNWYHCYIGRGNTRNKRRGISGEYFLTYSEIQVDTIKRDSIRGDSIVINPPDQSYWVTYRPSRLNPGARVIPSARLFYGTPDYNDTTEYKGAVGQVRVATDHHQQSIRIRYEGLINEITLTDTLSQFVRINFDTPPNLPIYGVSLESPKGLILDNFSSRGNLGPGLKYIAQSTLEAFQQKLDYDLIILQFGLNVTNPTLTDLSWYERDMMSVIDHYQLAFPHTSILIIGPPDKAAKQGGRMRTDPSVPRINAALQRVAIRSGVAFFSMYEAMGGEGSMVEWVEKKRPKLANFDYTHFNFKGAAIAGNYVTDFLMKGLEAYKKGELKGRSTKGEGEELSLNE